MAELRSILETCDPRPDVLGGGLADTHFAAQLDQVVRNPGGYPVYGDPLQFFALTYPTAGLKRLLTRTFGRLSGAKIEGAEHGLIRSETSFGGGKTHSLMAVYHLAKGARPPNISEFLDPGLLPTECQVAAVVGDTLDPENGLETNGIRSYTMWGEIGAQLGSDAWHALSESDAHRTAPGKITLQEAVGTRPTVIIIDEIALYLRQLASSGNRETRRLGEALPAFLKNLSELASGSPNVVVIVTLATRADAYGKETNELEDLLNELGGSFATTLADTESVLARTQSIVKPADESEIAEILKRRLFLRIDAESASAAGHAYASYYEGLAARNEPLSGGAEAPVTYGEAVSASYPFHPELIRVLDQRIGAIPNFQRARGALRLLAEVIAGIWAETRETEIINVADIDFGQHDILAHLTHGIKRPEFEQVAQGDFASPLSRAAAIDSSRFPGRLPYATRACATVFTHSLEQVLTSGAGRNDYLLGTLRIGDEPAVIGEALAEVERVAWHLFYDGLRWRFLTEPNVNAIISEETKNVPNTRVNAELEDLIRKAFPSAGAIKTKVFASGPADLLDKSELMLGVFHHDDVEVDSRSSVPPPAKLVEALDHAGVGGGIRTYRNAVLFLAADADAKEAMRDRVRSAIAVAGLVAESSRMQHFSADVQKRLRAASDAAKLDARVAIARCFKHLYIPAADKANSYLRHVELSPKSQGEADKVQTQVIQQVLSDEGKVWTTKIATNYVESKAWPPGVDEVTTEQISAAFWRDHGARLVLDSTLLKDAIRDGVKNGSWVYYDIPAQKLWTAHDAAPPVTLSSESMLYTLARATELGLMTRDLAWTDVANVLVETAMSGPALRHGLEAQLGRDVSKSEMAEVLSRAADGPGAKVVVVTGNVELGMKACTPAQIKALSLDTLTILLPSEAQRLSIVILGVRKVSAVEASGVAGVAFQALRDRAIETASDGFSTLSITAAAELGEGPKDISLLGKALGMLPKLDIDVSLHLDLDFKGLTGGAPIALTGAAADYQRVEDSILGLASKASAVAGTLRLDIRFATPCRPDSGDYERIRKVIYDLHPGELRLRGLLA
jgi:Protein of unknown function (DUF499)